MGRATPRTAAPRPIGALKHHRRHHAGADGARPIPLAALPHRLVRRCLRYRGPPDVQPRKLPQPPLADGMTPRLPAPLLPPSSFIASGSQSREQHNAEAQGNGRGHRSISHHGAPQRSLSPAGGESYVPLFPPLLTGAACRCTIPTAGGRGLGHASRRIPGLLLHS